MKIRIIASARVHINSIDMYGLGERYCGGLGFSVSEPYTILEARKSDVYDVNINIPGIYELLRKIEDLYDKKMPVEIELKSMIEPHVGLGSQTQLRLSLITAMLRLYGIIPNYEKICENLRMCRSSAVGLGSFLYGGFIIDSGYKRSIKKSPSTIIWFHHIPKEWKVILVRPYNIHSLTEEEEIEFFRRSNLSSEDETKTITYHLLMGLIPSIVEGDFESFLANLNKVNNLGSKKFEIELNKPYTEKILGFLKDKFSFAGLSSLGPTCYAFTQDEINASEIQSALPECEVIITDVNNNPHQEIIL